MATPSQIFRRAIISASSRILRKPNSSSISERSTALAIALASAVAIVSPQVSLADIRQPSERTTSSNDFNPFLKPASADSVALEPVSKPYQPPSSHSALLEAVAALDLSAVQSLAILANDLDNHIPLLQSGAAVALHSALKACNALEEKEAEALRVNLLRVLADLSRAQQAHSYIRDSEVASILAKVLAKYRINANDGWYESVLRWFGFGERQNERKTAKEVGSDLKKPRENIGDAAVDYLTAELSLNAMNEVDLAAGIAYHSARCVANLARNTEIHGHLLSSGVLQPLLVSLQNAQVGEEEDQQQVELLRCTVLAVAALCKSAASDVVHGGGHKKLIEFMGQYEDPVMQMYAAGGVRNLARHTIGAKDQWKTHRELVVEGVVSALEKGMDKRAGAQTQVFATLAFGDLMTTGHHKADIIRRRLASAYKSFANLVHEKNVSVARALYRTLIGLFGEEDEEQGGAKTSETIVPEPLANCLAEECGQLVNGAVARGDLMALKAARSMCRNTVVAKSMVEKGLLEVLSMGVRKGKGDYWEESIAALSILSGREEFASLIMSRGVLKAVLQRPCLEHNGRWSAAFFANMARSTENHAEIAHGGLKTLLLALSSKDAEAKREGARGLYNLSLGGVSRVMLLQGGSLSPLVSAAASTSGAARRYAIGALGKISEAYEHATKLIEADIISVLLKAAREDEKVAKDVAMCFGHLSQDLQVHGSLATSGAAAWLVDMVSKNGGRGKDAADVMHYATLGICNMAYSDGITRTILRECGAVRILTALSSSRMSAPHVIYSARQALHNLKGNEKPSMVTVEAPATPSLPA